MKTFRDDTIREVVVAVAQSVRWKLGDNYDLYVKSTCKMLLDHAVPTGELKDAALRMVEAWYDPDAVEPAMDPEVNVAGLRSELESIRRKLKEAKADIYRPADIKTELDKTKRRVSQLEEEWLNATKKVAKAERTRRRLRAREEDILRILRLNPGK